MAKILIIDEEEASRYTLKEFLESDDHDVSCPYSLDEANACIESCEYSIIFIDIDFENGNGILFLKTVNEMINRPEVIIITDDISQKDARKVLENGVWDIFFKPLSINYIRKAIEGALDFWERKNKISQVVNIAKDILLGSSSAMVECQEMAGIAAKDDVPVLIMGKTGTGKELLANIIHQNSRRKNGNFVIVDCASLPQNLAESILFGSKKGAFTDATNDKDGLVSQAHGGTLFLDEIGELPLVLQKTFLRMLQEKRFRPVGAKHEVASDFRLISATNKNLAEMVQHGEFREDLFFRIQSLVIKPPTLAGRKQDIAELVNFHINRRCKQQGRLPNPVAPEFMQTLQYYSWPGNVRELFNIIDSCLAKATEDCILVSKYLPVHIRIESSGYSVVSQNTHNSKSSASIPELKIYRKLISSRAEKKYLENLINQDKFDIEEACLISGLSRSRFYELLKKYQLPVPRSANEPVRQCTDFLENSLPPNPIFPHRV